MWLDVYRRTLLCWSTLFTVALLLQLVTGGPPKTCPIYCNCNSVDNLNHADCSGKRLISPNSAVPFEVQSLDLSYNDITILDNNCFEGYVYLLNITISHNAIHTIFLDVFEPLKRIRAIDLSHNRLETIDPRLFESNRRLHTLNLAGNKFLSLLNEPLLHSRSLQKLDLADAQINVLLPEHYSGLPQLQDLDLAQNLIITIDQFAAQPPKQLRVLNLDENNLNCDHSLQTALQQLKARNVEVDYKYCQAASVDPTDDDRKKFERIELMDGHRIEEKPEVRIAEDDVGDSQEDFDDAIRSGDLSGWHFPLTSVEDRDDYTDIDVAENEESGNAFPATYNNKTMNETCRRLCEHTVNKSIAKLTSNDAIDFSTKQYTDFDLLFAFICGIAVGIALTIFIGSCIICIWRCTALKARQVQVEDAYDTPYTVAPQSCQPSIPRQSPTSHTAVDTIRRPSAREVETTQERLPVIYPQPPRRRRHCTASTQRSVRRDQLVRPGSDNFISRLFGRPARHQYYRTINENTATLIRRLSRSNLFNNRLSQHFGERDRDRERNTAISAPNTPSDSPDGTIAANLNDELESLTTATRIPHRRRPETPPPLYSEIIAKECDRRN